jgi:hypothetical protein
MDDTIVAVRFDANTGPKPTTTRECSTRQEPLYAVPLGE